MSFRIRGEAATKRALERAQSNVRAAAPVAAQASGDLLAAQMRSRAPRDTGALASSISVEVSSSVVGAVARVGADVDYDRFVQLGTVYMSAQPYGEEGARASTSEIIAAQAAIYKRAVESL